MKRVKVIAIIGGTKHPTHGRLVKDKEYEIDVDKFGDQIFKPKTKADEKVLKDYLVSLEKKEEPVAAPLEEKQEEKKEEVTE